MEKKRVHYEIVRFDSIHGISYPYTFERATDLRTAGMYEPAAYDYVMLYPDFRDSVVHACLSMDQELIANHDSNSTVYYLKQCVVGEAMHDPEVWHDGKLVQKAIDKRYVWVDGLLHDLKQYGIQ